jgi:hypothetical protein
MSKHMISSCRRSALAVLAGLLFLLTGCHRAPKDSGPLYIMLMFNGGACSQNGSSGVIEIDPDRAVIFQTAAELTEFEVRFTACPFSSCPASSPNGRAVNVGPPNPGTVGTTFMYAGITMNHQSCSNAGTMGLRVKPAP